MAPPKGKLPPVPIRCKEQGPLCRGNVEPGRRAQKCLMCAGGRRSAHERVRTPRFRGS